VATYNQPPVPDRSPGDFHSTGAPYVPRNDSRGTKPARAYFLAVAQKGYIKGLQALRNKYARKLKRAPCESFSTCYCASVSDTPRNQIQASLWLAL
jgi:hypothetical protein